MNELVISEMKRVLELQKKKHIEEGPPSLELRKDRLDRSISMVKNIKMKLSVLYRMTLVIGIQ